MTNMSTTPVTNASSTAASSPFTASFASGNQFFPFFAANPSFDVSLAAAVAVSAVAVVHGYLVYKTKAKYFFIIVQGALFFAVGMALRLFIVTAPTNPAANTANTVMTILLQAPGSLVAISLIFTYTRLMWWVTPEEQRNTATLWLPPRATSICIGLAQGVCDGISMLGSGIIPSPGPRTLAIGSTLEMLVFMFFATLVIRFTLMSRRWPMPFEEDRTGSWELGCALSVSSILLVIRSIMLVLEKDAQQALISTGKPASIITTQEWPTWVFDFLPTFLILVIMMAYHPGRYLPRRLTGFRLRGKLLAKEKRANRESQWVIKNGGIIFAQEVPPEPPMGRAF